MTKRLRLSLSLILLVSACGGAHKATNSNAPQMPRSASEAEPNGGLGYSEDPREHIAQLFDEIGAMRQVSGFAREPAADDVRLHGDAETPQSSEPASVAAGAEMSVCERTCEVKSKICHNATKICKLAGELHGTEWDEWANEKCNSGKASCTEATSQCDECDG